MCNMLDPYVQQFLNSSESKITINNITAIVRKDEGPIELGTCGKSVRNSNWKLVVMCLLFFFR